MPYAVPEMDDDPEYQTVSVIDGFAADPGVFLRPAQSVAGVDEATIQATYEKLLKGCLTWIRPEDRASNPGDHVANVKYPEVNPTRLNWMTMRADWTGKQSMSAYEFEGDFLRYQVYTENCIYVVAEHIARYQAMFKTAKDDITRLTNTLTQKFSAWKPRLDIPVRVDWPSVLISGLVVVVITEGAGSTKPGLDDHYHYRDIAKQYLDQVNKIEDDLRTSIEQLYESLRVEVDRLRERRTYEPVPASGEQSTFVPHFKDYVA